MKKKNITGIMFGTFDILHQGHLRLFEQARKHSDYLIVVIARDETVKKVKNNYPKNLERKRQSVVKNSGVAEKVILGSLKDKYMVIKKYQPDIIFLGYDQSAFVDKLYTEIAKLKMNTKIIRLKSFKPEIYKTSLILKL